MNIRTLLLLVIAMGNISLSYGWYARIVPVTLHQGRWYGLFGHKADAKDMNQGWTDFNKWQLAGWGKTPAALSLEALKEQTNNFAPMTEEDLTKWGAEFTRGRDVFYYVYISVPKGETLRSMQDVLTVKAYTTPKSMMNGFQWVPIDKIIKEKTIKGSLPSDASGQEIALVIKDLTVANEIKNRLKVDWYNVVLPELRETLREHNIIIPISQKEPKKEKELPKEGPKIPNVLSDSLALLHAKLSNLKQLLSGKKVEKEKGEEGAKKESLYKSFLKGIGYEEL